MTTDAARAGTLAVTLTPTSRTPTASAPGRKRPSRPRAVAGPALRVLCPGSSAYGAAVSEPLQLVERLSLTAPASSPASPPAGPAAPGQSAPAPSQPAAAPPAT